MTKDKALKMAIEAMVHHTEQTRPIEDTKKAIQACKDALENLEKDPSISRKEHPAKEQLTDEGEK